MMEINIEPLIRELDKADDTINKIRDFMRISARALIFRVNAPMAYPSCLTSCGLVTYYRISSRLLSACCQCNGDVLVEFDDKKHVLTPSKAVKFINGLHADGLLVSDFNISELD